MQKKKLWKHQSISEKNLILQLPNLRNCAINTESEDKSFRKGKNRQAKMFGASRNFWDGLSDIYLTPIILNQVLLYFVRELPPKFQHHYQLHAFFFSSLYLDLESPRSN